MRWAIFGTIPIISLAVQSGLNRSALQEALSSLYEPFSRDGYLLLYHPGKPFPPPPTGLRNHPQLTARRVSPRGPLLLGRDLRPRSSESSKAASAPLSI